MLNFSNFSLSNHFLSHKTDYLRLVLLYMWVKYDLVWMSFSAQHENFMFVNPIVNKICTAPGQFLFKKSEILENILLAYTQHLPL